jgi:hypothetical protein
LKEEDPHYVYHKNNWTEIKEDLAHGEFTIFREQDISNVAEALKIKTKIIKITESQSLI